MKFDYVIGNPPYQADNKDNNRQSPVYHLFMEEAFKISEIVELITPARFYLMQDKHQVFGIKRCLTINIIRCYSMKRWNKNISKS